MKITILGTAGAPIPSSFCNCSRCEIARENGGKDVRKRCCYLINDNLLVDMGPDLFVACSIHNVHLMDVKYGLVTHSHNDHFYATNLTMRKKGFPDKLPQLDLLAPPSVMTLLNGTGVKDDVMGIKRNPILPYDQVDLGEYQVKALKATHHPTVGDAVNYFIDDGTSKVLIASDTAVYKNEVWPHLEGIALDQLLIECTVGTRTDFVEGQQRHLSISGVKTMINKMKEIGAITDKTAICATHFAHQYCPTHEELSSILEEIDVECAYDGLILNC